MTNEFLKIKFIQFIFNKDVNGVKDILSQKHNFPIDLDRIFIEKDNDKNNGRREMIYVNPLIIASRYVPSLEIVTALLEYGADVNCYDMTKITPLGHACQANNDAIIIHRLLQYGADPNMKDTLGQTPLHFACYMGNNEAVKLLLSYGADPLMRDADGDQPIHRSVMSLSVETVQTMIKTVSDIDTEGEFGHTPLQRALLKEIPKDDEYPEEIRCEMIQLLLNCNRNAVNSKFKDHEDCMYFESFPEHTLLHVAIICNYKKIANCLLEYFPDTSIVNEENQTAMDVALELNNRQYYVDAINQMLHKYNDRCKMLSYFRTEWMQY